MAGSELLKVARPPAAALPELAALLGQDGPILVDGVAQRQVLAKRELLPQLSVASPGRKTETAAWSSVAVCGEGPGNLASRGLLAK